MREHLDILVKARALIAERKNWTKDMTARNAIGLSTGVYSEDAASFCLFGALVRAAGLSRQDDVDLVIAAMLATNNLDPYGFPADFNDSHEHSEVLAVVDKTIASVRASRALPSLIEIQSSPVPAKEPA